MCLACVPVASTMPPSVACGEQRESLSKRSKRKPPLVEQAQAAVEKAQAATAKAQDAKTQQRIASSTCSRRPLVLCAAKSFELR